MTPTILADGFAFLEGPRWHQGALYVSDMHDETVYRISPDGSREIVCRVEERPSGLGWMPNGDMLVVSMMDRSVLRMGDDGILVPHADLSAIAPKRTNDMIVDTKGRAYVGNFGFIFDEGEAPVPTTLALVLEDGTAQKAADGLMFPNGMVITDNGGTLVVGESYGARLTAFDISPDGQLSNQRVWASLSDG
ncbi:MAG: SMP-30/gluconolactonase/LRE family protein, partial [Pseudomonadota bacterium]